MMTLPLSLAHTPLRLSYADLGQADDYVGKDVTGKIVLLSRGSLAFVDKIEIAKEQGALAAIIFNGIPALATLTVPICPIVRNSVTATSTPVSAIALASFRHLT